MKYEVKAPIHSIGDIVDFIHHNGNMFKGRITYCETHYDTRGYRHIYCVHREGNKRSVWIVENKIVSNTQTFTEPKND